MLLLSCVDAACQLALLVAIAHLLPSAATGRFVYALDAAGLVALMAPVGFHLSAVRLLPTLRAKSDNAGLAAFIAYAHKAVLAGSLIGLLLAAGHAYAVSYSGDTKLVMCLGLAALTIPLQALLALHIGVLRGFGYAVTAKSVQLAATLLSVVFVVFTAACVGVEFLTPVNAMTAVLIARVAALALSSIVCLKHAPPRGERGVSPPSRGWFWTSLGMTFLMSAQLLLTRLDAAMIGWHGDPEAVAAYSLVARLGLVMTFVITAANFVISPVCAELHTLGRTAELERLARKTAQIALSSTVGISVLLAAVAWPLLNWLGPVYAEGYPILLVLIVLQIGVAGMGPAPAVASMTGNESRVATVFGGCLAANALLNALVIPFGGAIAAAMTTTVTVIAGHALAAKIVKQRTGVSTLPFPRRGVRSSRTTTPLGTVTNPAELCR